MIPDDSTTTMDKIAINGNSGIVGVGEGEVAGEEVEEEDGDKDGEGLDVGVVDVVGEEEDELEVASTVPLKSLLVIGSEVPLGA